MLPTELACSVRTNIGRVLFLHAARSINLQKKNETNIFPVRTEQVSSIKFLLSWLYFEFPDGTAHVIGEMGALL